MRYFIIYIFSLGLFALYKNSAKAQIPLIVEGNVWEYVEEYESKSTGEHWFHFSRYGFTLSENRYGRIYHQWTLLDQHKFEYIPNPTNPTWQMVSICLNTPIAWLREENGVIYQLIESSTIKYFNPKTNKVELRNVTIGDEAILYKFNATVGERFEILYNSEIISDCVMKDIQEFDQNGQKLKSYSIVTEYENPEIGAEENDCYYISYVESVGNITNGTLTSIFTNAYTPIAPNGDKHIEGFNSLYDPNGNILFSGLGILKPSNINDIKAPIINNINQSAFDLYGRTVTNPLPGSVYIRNGKKYIGK